MPSANGLIADSESVRAMADGTEVLTFLEERFRAFGATHFLVTGMPLPGRPIEPLILRVNWGEARGERPHVDPDDPVLQSGAPRPPGVLLVREPANDRRPSPHSARLPDRRTGRVLSACRSVRSCPTRPASSPLGRKLSFDLRAAMALDDFCTEAFRRLFAPWLHQPRSSRRTVGARAHGRRTVGLRQDGERDRFASLQISQRTVHAHLQNASEKLRASNKTHTVVEALIYGQISV